MIPDDNTLIQHIEAKNLDELNEAFNHISFVSIEVLTEIINSNDYDIISSYGNSDHSTDLFYRHNILDVLFIEKRVLELLIENNNGFIHKYSESLMKKAIKYEDYEIMRLLSKKVKLKSLTLKYGVCKGVEMIKFLTNIGIDIDDNGTAFNEAVRINNYDVVQYMHENGYIIKLDYFCLSRKNENISMEIVEFLVNLGISVSDLNQLLIIAIENNNVMMVEYLIYNGANKLEFNFLRFNCISFNIFSLLVENKIDFYDDKIFHYLDNFNKNILQYMIDNKIDIHYNYDMLLSENVKDGNMENVIFLLDNGADICTGFNEPLRIAAFSGNLEMVKCLIEYDNFKFTDNNILMGASASGNLKLVKYLVEEHNITPNNQSLLYSVRGSHVDIFNYLINYINLDVIDVANMLNECNIINEYDTINFINRNKTTNYRANPISQYVDIDKQQKMIFNLLPYCKLNELKNIYPNVKHKFDRLLKNSDKYGIIDYLHNIGII